MTVAIIAAMSRNRVIGYQGAMPWHLPEDLRRFRELTSGHPVVMGRKTFEAIGRALPGRKNIVISRNSSYLAEGCLMAGSLQEALHLGGDSLIFICGGGEIYRTSMAIADIIYLTVIDADLQGDTFFPEIPPEFIEVSRESLSTAPQANLITYCRSKTSGAAAPP